MKRKNVRSKLKKKNRIIFIIFFLIICLGYIISQYYFKEKEQNNHLDTDKLKKEYVYIEQGKTINKTNVYINNNDQYTIAGEIEQDISLTFVKLVDEYLLIDGFEQEYYVKAEAISADNITKTKNSRYQEYIPFNENIITKEKTSFYDENNNLLYTLETSYELPIIIKDDNKYGVEFNNELLYINESDVKEIKAANNTEQKNSSGVGVLNYHFFYDENNQEEKSECNQIICQSKTKFQSELDYLKENNILTITTQELEWYIDGKVNLPKSVLITIDDGYMMNHALELLEQNKMYGCVFLITSWFDNVDFKDDFEYVEFQSHGEKIHDVGTCPGGQGGGIKCLPREQLLADLKTSSDKLGGSFALAYPFYEYNDYSIEILKEAGYRMAFAGENTNSDNLVHVGSNKYRIPRFVMVSYTTESDLDKYFSNIK